MNARASAHARRLNERIVGPPEGDRSAAEAAQQRPVASTATWPRLRGLDDGGEGFALPAKLGSAPAHRCRFSGERRGWFALHFACVLVRACLLAHFVPDWSLPCCGVVAAFPASRPTRGKHRLLAQDGRSHVMHAELLFRLVSSYTRIVVWRGRAGLAL